MNENNNKPRGKRSGPDHLWSSHQTGWRKLRPSRVNKFLDLSKTKSPNVLLYNPTNASISGMKAQIMFLKNLGLNLNPSGFGIYQHIFLYYIMVTNIVENFRVVIKSTLICSVTENVNDVIFNPLFITYLFFDTSVWNMTFDPSIMLMVTSITGIQCTMTAI